MSVGFSHSHIKTQFHRTMDLVKKDRRFSIQGVCDQTTSYLTVQAHAHFTKVPHHCPESESKIESDFLKSKFVTKPLVNANLDSSQGLTFLEPQIYRGKTCDSRNELIDVNSVGPMEKKGFSQPIPDFYFRTTCRSFKDTKYKFMLCSYKGLNGVTSRTPIDPDQITSYIIISDGKISESSSSVKFIESHGGP